MEKLILLRHGDYKTDSEENDLGLTSEGEENIRQLGKSLVSHLQGDLHIFSSPMPRTLQSAEILDEVLDEELEFEVNFPQERVYELVCEYDHLLKGQAEDIYRKIMPKEYVAKNIVLVSHFAIKDYLEYYLLNQFGKKVKIDKFEKASAIILDTNDPNPKVRYIPG